MVHRLNLLIIASINITSPEKASTYMSYINIYIYIERYIYIYIIAEKSFIYRSLQMKRSINICVRIGILEFIRRSERCRRGYMIYWPRVHRECAGAVAVASTVARLSALRWRQNGEGNLGRRPWWWWKDKLGVEKGPRLLTMHAGDVVEIFHVLFWFGEDSHELSFLSHFLHFLQLSEPFLQ